MPKRVVLDRQIDGNLIIERVAYSSQEPILVTALTIRRQSSSGKFPVVMRLVAAGKDAILKEEGPEFAWEIARGPGDDRCSRSPLLRRAVLHRRRPTAGFPRMQTSSSAGTPIRSGCTRMGCGSTWTKPERNRPPSGAFRLAVLAGRGPGTLSTKVQVMRKNGWGRFYDGASLGRDGTHGANRRLSPHVRDAGKGKRFSESAQGVRITKKAKARKTNGRGSAVSRSFFAFSLFRPFAISSAKEAGE